MIYTIKYVHRYIKVPYSNIRKQKSKDIVGSSPTSQLVGEWRNWYTHLSKKMEPVFLWGYGEIGYHAALARLYSEFESL